MTQKLNEMALGYSAAIVSAATMLLLGMFGSIGFYKGASTMMMQWHMFYSMTPFGIITGTVESGLIGFVFGYAFGWLYNRFA